MESIKELKAKAKVELDDELLTYCKSKGMDFSYVLKMEYARTEIYLKNMVFRSEKALMDCQAEDLPNENRIKSLEQTYNRLLFIYEKFTQMDLKIKELETENQMLKDKFDFFKANRK